MLRFNFTFGNLQCMLFCKTMGRFKNFLKTDLKLDRRYQNLTTGSFLQYNVLYLSA